MADYDAVMTQAEYDRLYGSPAQVPQYDAVMTSAEYNQLYGQPAQPQGYQAEGTIGDTLLDVGKAASRAGDWATFGLSTKAGSGISSLISKVTGDERPLSDIYQSTLDLNREAQSDLPMGAKVASSGLGILSSAPVNIGKALQLGKVTAPVANIMSKTAIGRNLAGAGRVMTEGALQSGLDAYGHDRDISDNALLGAGASGLFKVLGNSARGVGNALEGSQLASQARVMGLNYGDLADSSKRAVREAGSEIPILDAMQNMAKRGEIDYGGASGNLASVLSNRKGKQGEIAQLVKIMNQNQPNQVINEIIPAKAIESSILDQYGKKIMSLIPESVQTKTVLKSPISNLPKAEAFAESATSVATRDLAQTQIQNWKDKLKSGPQDIGTLITESLNLKSEAAMSYGAEGSEAVAVNLKKWMARDLDEQIAQELSNTKVYGPNALPEFKRLNKELSEGYALESTFRKAEARDKISSPKDKITNFVKTTGGASGAIIAGQLLGIPAPVTAAIALPLATKQGQLATGITLEGLGKIARPTGQGLSDNAPLIARLLSASSGVGQDSSQGNASQQFPVSYQSNVGTSRSEQEQPKSSTTISPQLSQLKNLISDYKAKDMSNKEQNKSILVKTVIESGISDPDELKQFMAQMEHESGGFKSLVEKGSGAKYEGRKDLGNTQKGDGEKFKGRGFVQLTGRYNYKKYGDLIGVDLIKNPELAEKPEIAAKLAAAYWNDRVKPNVSDFKDIKAVTKLINGGYNGLADRQQKLANYNSEGNDILALLQEIASRKA